MSNIFQPNFFIIGAAKSATTSLSSLLETHPETGMVRRKEAHFFSFDQNYIRGWEYYLTQFSHCAGKKAIGDASTSYSRIRYYPNTILRLHHHAPGAKIIYMVRHPIKRMESAYIEHACAPKSQAFPSINDAIRHLSMIVDSSRYWEVFDAYRRKFDESRIKIVWFEEYVADQAAVFQDVCRYLEIDDSFVPDFSAERTNSRENAATRMTKLGRSDIKLDITWDEGVRQWVIDQIREDNLQFLTHFGRPKNYWGDLF